MKKILCILSLTLLLAFSPNSAKAQAWQKSTKVLALGIGGSYFWHIGNGYYSYGNIGYYPSYGWRLTGQLNFQGEFGIHKYVGIGFTTGVGGSAGWKYSIYYNTNGEVNWPAGVIANFHFFQLIADKTGKNIHADKLDVYAGVNVGSGIAAMFFSTGTKIVPIFFAGPQVGVRYYFSKRVGVNGEVGFGKSWVNAGFVFKLSE